MPAGPPLSARLAAWLRRLGWRLRDLLPAGSAARLPVRRLVRRLALGLGCTVAVTAVVLAVPVVSGAGGERTPVALDSSATTSAGQPESGEPVVVMGVDGDGSATSSSASRAERPAGSATPESSAESSTEAPTGAAALPGTTASGSTASAPGTTTRASAPDGTSSRSTPSRSTSPGSRAPSSGSSSGSPSSTPPPSSEPPAPPSPAGADLEAQLVALVAQARTEAGCASSAADPTLTDVARRHSADMAAAGGLQPLDLAAWAVRGAAVGQGPADPAAVVAQWLADPAVGAQLLDCAATGLGAGVADGPWYTVVLA